MEPQVPDDISLEKKSPALPSKTDGLTFDGEVISLLDDPQKLYDCLRARGTDKTRAMQFILLSQAADLPQFLRRRSGEKITARDLDMLVQKARERSGLTYPVIFDIFYGFFSRTGVGVLKNREDYKTAAFKPSGKAFIVPPEAVRSEVLRAVDKLKLDPADKDAYACLEQWAAAGQAPAVFARGKILLESGAAGEQAEKALRDIRYASDNGETEASAYLGDYYFNVKKNTELAYIYYTEPGSRALNEKQRENLMYLLGMKKFGVRNLIMAGALWLLFLFTYLSLPPAASGGPGRGALGIAALAVCGLTCCAGAVFHLIFPHASKRLLIPAVFAEWCAYIYILLLA